MYTPINTESSGVWQLFKLREPQRLTLAGGSWRWEPQTAKALRQRITWKVMRPWAPLGFEEPRLKSWARVRTQSDAEQFRWLDRVYQNRFSREAVAARSEKGRLDRERRRRRQGWNSGKRGRRRAV
jgi:hypothetical protein